MQNDEMNIITDEEIKLLQKHQFFILKELKKICEDNSIEFFLIAGSLLGAVRHSGFIPWDDDVDVGMTRENYEKLKSIDLTKFNSELFLQDIFSDVSYDRPHLKLRLNNTLAVNNNYFWNAQHGGISVSIFIFDKVSNNEVSRKVQYFLHNVLNKFIYVTTLNSKDTRSKYYSFTKLIDPSLKRKIKSIVLIIISLLINRKLISKVFVYNMSRYKDKNTQYYFPFATYYPYEKHLIKEKWISSLKEMEFNNVTFKVPESYELYLKQLYNDYMKLPPVEKRYNKHNIVKLKFRDDLDF